ncbi:c-type cytochrome [Aquabacterium sp.]|uniref:c-type cytochrome n=1 Tax=Aquabacterium sp. TaxID=1872578 RepID=UPI002C4EBF61|nr:c-type cytochrome [Aquabacterium sp.]HSW08299.1 c-type cytochrome [Aquabacterium sp.]
MKRWIKFPLIGLAAVLAAAAATLAFANHRSQSRMTRTVALPAYALALPEDAASIERGRYLYQSRGCTDCHGQDGAGRVFINDDGIGLRLAGPNISPGPGNVVAHYKGEDWERTLRHGVKPSGQPLLVMPSEDYARWTDADVAAVAAYVRQMPPKSGGPAVLQLPLPVRVMYGLGLMPDAAERIDHGLPPPQPVPEGVSLAHGQYVANSCLGCHGQLLSGGKIPGAPPDWPDAANLTPGAGSAMPRYASATEFRTMLRSGRRPDGSRVSIVMPFESLARMSDTDIDAAYLYLKSLPPRPVGR